MQKTISLFFALLFAIPAFAQQERCLLKIRDRADRMITAEINGRRYNNVGRMLTFTDLPARRHNLRLYAVSPSQNSRSNARLIYEGNLRTRPGNIYYVTVDQFEKLDIIVDCCLGDNGPWTDENGWYRSRYYDKQNWERDMQYNPQQKAYYEDLNGPRSRRQNDVNDPWQSNRNVMTTAQYNRLIGQLRDAGFENNRMNLVKTAIEDNPVTAQQLTGILNELSFESSRLQIAKFAYAYLVNPKDAFLIDDAFQFSSSKDEFHEFIRNQRR